MALINLRNALMSGKRLPYDAEVEFLESTGTQYIEVPMAVDNSATVSITGYIGTTNKELFSFDKRSSYKQFNIETGATYYRWWSSLAINIGSGYVGSLHSYKCNSSIWVDGVLKSTSTATSADTTHTFYILNGTHGATSGRIYHVSVEYGGRLIFDGIPVRKGTVGYLYDRVSGKLFGNAGTGDFVLGQDVVPVEWLESSGNLQSHAECYFAAPYTFDGRTDAIEIECAYTDTVPYGTIFGVNQSLSGVAKRFNVRRANQTAYFDNAGQGATFPTTPLKLNAWYHIQVAGANNGGCFINDTTGTLAKADTYVFTEPMYIFCGKDFAGSNNTSWSANAQLRYFKHRRNGSLITSFRPVRVGTEGAMMDVLTRRIYRNAGTGAFTYGNDLKYPIPTA